MWSGERISNIWAQGNLKQTIKTKLILRQLQKKAAIARNVLDNAFLILAPDAPNYLRKLTLQESATNVFTRSAGADSFAKLMENIAVYYSLAENSSERLNVLSLVANIIPLSQVQEYIPGELE